MQQIADLAGVSKSAVSLAMSNNPRLPRATRDRIQAIAESLGYQRNPIVDTLMTQLRASQQPRFQANIGLINCSKNRDISSNHTFCALREGVCSRSEQLGYGVEEFWLDEPFLRPKRLRQILETRSIRGLILMATLTPHEIHEGYEDFWDSFACAVIGVTHAEKMLPSATNDQYLTVRRAVEKVLGIGYQRPVLVAEKQIDELLDNRFSAGFFAATRHLPTGNQFPMIELNREDPAALIRAVKQANPDVIITNESFVRDWLENAGYAVPRSLGMVHLDWHAGLDHWAGMAQNNVQVGSAGADLVIHQLHKNEYGPQQHPKVVMLESEWRDGASVRSQPSTASRRRRTSQAKSSLPKEGKCLAPIS